MLAARDLEASLPVESDESPREDEDHQERGVQQEGCGELDTETS